MGMKLSHMIKLLPGRPRSTTSRIHVPLQVHFSLFMDRAKWTWVGVGRFGGLEGWRLVVNQPWNSWPALALMEERRRRAAPEIVAEAFANED
jgi:hypothetical protein